jgi:hypothetical protein
MNKRLMS